MSVLIDGKATSLKIKEKLKNNVAEIKQKFGVSCKLALIIVGEDPASMVYVANKEKACAYVGVQSHTVRLPSTVSQEQIINIIDELAADNSVNGILVQLPLPKGFCEREILAHVPVEKDVDGLTFASEGKLLLGEQCSVSCTPKGVMALLNEYSVELSGKNAVVVGRSNMVGKPMAVCLLSANCTVTVCHSRTQNLSDFTSNADILVVAMGKPRFITADMVKEGAAVIDVGINRVDGKLVGDVDFDSVEKKAGCITPVPGGVGPMTVTMLIENTIEAAIKQNGLNYEL